MALRGAKKRTSELAHVALGNRALLTSRLVREVVQFMDHTQPHHWLAPLLLLAWALLGRVQSEILPLELGAETDAVALPPSRHSGVWQDFGKTLWVRLRRRKHRPYGSLLSVECECTKDPRFCAGCRVMGYAMQNGVRGGAKLWSGATPSISLSALHRVLTLLRVVAPSTYSWKAVRAGHATELALTPGVSIATIMAKGEWRSAAVLAYLRPEDVHTASFVAKALEDSDAEEE